MAHDNAGRYVFGPVPSRRLGRSLGIDLVPYKTCTFDCVYCQLGHTTHKTIQRQAYVPWEDVLAQLEAALQHAPKPDFVTLSGSGEPTLFEPLGELIRSLKTRTEIPLAVLTNGSLLWQAEVREALRAADLVIPSLDAADEEHFRLVNRPHPAITFAQFWEGLEAFCRSFPGAIWLEIFLIGGLTAREEHVRRLAPLVERLQPERVQLNTVVRPPAEAWAQPASPAELQEAARILGSRCEIIGDFAAPAPASQAAATEEAVLDLLQRRPCRLEDIAGALGLHRNEAAKWLAHLLKAKRIEPVPHEGETYYRGVQGKNCP